MAEKVPGNGFDGLVKYQDTQASFYLEAPDGNETYFGFKYSKGKTDIDWVRRFCQNLRITFRPIPKTKSYDEIKKLFEIIEQP
jgi:hypothetical protein